MSLIVSKQPDAAPVTEQPKFFYIYQDGRLWYSGSVEEYILDHSDNFLPADRSPESLINDICTCQDRDVVVTKSELTPAEIKKAGNLVLDMGDCYVLTSRDPMRLQEIDCYESCWFDKVTAAPDLPVPANMKPLSIWAKLGIWAVVLTPIAGILAMLVLTGALVPILAVLHAWAVGMWFVLGWGLWIVGGVLALGLVGWLCYDESGQEILTFLIIIAILLAVLWMATYGIWSLGSSILAKGAP